MVRVVPCNASSLVDASNISALPQVVIRSVAEIQRHTSISIVARFSLLTSGARVRQEMLRLRLNRREPLLRQPRRRFDLLTLRLRRLVRIRALEARGDEPVAEIRVLRDLRRRQVRRRVLRVRDRRPRQMAAAATRLLEVCRRLCDLGCSSQVHLRVHGQIRVWREVSFRTPRGEREDLQEKPRP